MRPVAPLPPAPAATARSLASALPMRVDAPDPPMGRSPRVSSSIGISRGGGVPGTPDACITPPPAPLPRALTLKGGFTVLDPQQRRLDRQARAQGYSDPHSYLLARAQQQHRQRAWRAPRHRARPAQPARPAPPSGDRPALPGDPAAAGLLGGQAAGAPGGAGVR